MKCIVIEGGCNPMRDKKMDSQRSAVDDERIMKVLIMV